MTTKQKMLLLDLIAKILTILGLYCFGSLSGTYTFIISFFVVIFAYIKERLNKKWTLLFILFSLSYIVVLIYTYVGLSSILVFMTAFITTITLWWMPPQGIRFIGGWSSIIYLAYQITIRNWVGLLEIFVIISNFLAYAKNKKKA